MNIHFRITNYCNLQCKDCWGFGGKNTMHMTPAILTKALDYFSPIDVNDKINITGGEPTVNPYFEDMIEILQHVSAFKTLSTNAYDIIPTSIESLLKMNRIQLPMDGSNSSRFNVFRCDTFEYSSKITQVINKLKINEYNGIVKFGSVIVDNDLSDLVNICSKIKNYCLNKVEWRLYPLWKRNEKYSKIIASNELFRMLKEDCAQNSIQFSVFTPENRNEKYIFVNPDGTLSTIKNNYELAIGHL